MKPFVAVVFSIVTVAVAACSGHTAQVSDKPSSSSVSTSATQSSAPTSPPAAHVGDTLHLTGE